MSGMKERRETQKGELLEQLFELLFQTAWVSRYDPRRSSPVYGEFLRTAMLLAAALNRTDLRTADARQQRHIAGWVARLHDDVVRLRAEGVITSLQQAEAERLLRAIGEGIGEPV